MVSKNIKALYEKVVAFEKAAQNAGGFTDQEIAQWYGLNQEAKPKMDNSQSNAKAKGAPGSKPQAMNAGQAVQQAGNIDPTYQRLLGVKPDGKFGPETHKALDAYKDKIGQPGLNDGLALARLLSDNSGTAQQLAGKQL